jgi:hypothetical protein
MKLPQILLWLAVAGLTLPLAETLEAQQAAVTSANVVPADSDEGAAVVHLTDVDELKEEDISLGALVNKEKSDQYVVPELRKKTVTGQKRDWYVALTVGNLILFGENSVPLLVKGVPKETVRFQKTGLSARAPSDAGFEVCQQKQLFIVLENPAGFSYPEVRMRLRFENHEVCEAIPDKSAALAPPVKAAAESRAASSGNAASCEDPSTWVAFAVPQYAPVTLRINAPDAWFRDSQTDFPRAAKRKGVLTLHFKGHSGDPRQPVVYEQSMPLEVQFRPSDTSLFRNLLRVAGWLLVGALLALGLRVAIPNYHRKEALKEQLADAEKAMRSISVESALQVLLKVDRASLDQLRRSAWIIGPGFSDLATRIEQGIATLQRKLQHTRRLDTARGRRQTLLDQAVSPTRLAAIDRQLDAACEALLRDQLSDQDWVLVQQRLESADKLLAEPTQEEKDAFRALLVQRWTSLSAFFGRDNRKLKVPPSLKDIEAAFPPEDALPEAGDDGTAWIEAIGPVRADVQISALEVLRDFLFLAPSASAEAKQKLKELLLNPSQPDLEDAKLLIRRVSEGVDVERIKQALRACEAAIEITPQSVNASEKTHLALRFRNSTFNSSGARLSVRCEWLFKPGEGSKAQQALHEFGWEIFHCFPEETPSWDVTVRFYVAGSPLREEQAVPGAEQKNQPDAPLVEYKRTIRLSNRGLDWGNRLERIIPEAVQVGAALLVPLATLAVTQADQGTSGRWWELIGVGFGSEMIRSILTGAKPSQPT